jgi:transketolase
MPCAELFEAQDAQYREQVLPSDVLARVAVEAGHADYWYKYVGLDGRVVGMTSFGESAPAADLMKYFGFTVDNVVETLADILL